MIFVSLFFAPPSSLHRRFSSPRELSSARISSASSPRGTVPSKRSPRARNRIDMRFTCCLLEALVSLVSSLLYIRCIVYFYRCNKDPWRQIYGEHFLRMAIRVKRMSFVASIQLLLCRIKISFTSLRLFPSGSKM